MSSIGFGGPKIGFLDSGNGGGGGTVSLIQSPDATISVTNGAGPTVDLSAVYGPPVEYASTLVELPTATPPGAGPPTIPPYPGSLIWFSLGTSGAPKVIPPGSYVIDISFWIEVSTGNTSYWLDVFVNDAPSELGPGGVGPGVEDIGRANAQAPRSGRLDAVFAFDTPLWFDVRVAREAGSGTCTFKRGTIGIWKIA